MPTLTRQELAEHLRVTVRTIQNLEKRGLPALRVGDAPRYDLETVTNWLSMAPVGRVMLALPGLNALERVMVRELLDALDKASQ